MKFSLVRLFVAVLSYGMSEVVTIAELPYRFQKERIDILTEALIHNDYCIGVFEDDFPKPGDDQDWQLESGKRFDVGYSKPFFRTGNWHYLRRIKSIKGDFDRWILFDSPLALGPREIYAPVRRSRWVLVLKPALDQQNKLVEIDMMDITIPYDEKMVAELDFLSNRNFFVLRGRGSGAFCLFWPEGESLPPDVPIYSEIFLNELMTLQEAMTNTEDRISRVSKLEPKLKDPTIQAVAKEIIERLSK